jgi:hypothetical protein
VDIDFLQVEYDTGKPAGLVEYKNERAKMQYASHPSYRALMHLANAAEIECVPFVVEGAMAAPGFTLR